MAKIFLTGPPGCGKSRLVQEVIKELSVKVGGIATPEIREAGARKGFKIIDIASGKEGILASVDIKGKPRVSKYGVNVKDIDMIVDKFLESFDKADIYVMDELAPMELCSEKFRAMTERVLTSKKPVLIVIHRSLVEKYKNLGKVYHLTRENFDKLKKEIVLKLKL